MTHHILRRLCALALLLPAACTQFPALDSRATPEMLAAQYPALVPVDPLSAQLTTGQSDAEQIESTMDARVAGLQARAAQLRGSVLTDAEKQRLSEGLQ
ncbi:hypothetical protein SAMN04488040_0251 [Sulfitobacter marinus]|uniref:Uncharacterized protein n=1 Tax=Sulfitobacter marinus TaxID=394264 RepID=A0A1I6PMZ9_9RHOB|nr:hypothetical protein [Sulfitobacter marinus]SFS41562.1 hypothetical protein SAMN04488040_0251 [Sulfitobacter marinus]